jgi:hypothetical protein
VLRLQGRTRARSGLKTYIRCCQTLGQALLRSRQSAAQLVDMPRHLDPRHAAPNACPIKKRSMSENNDSLYLPSCTDNLWRYLRYCAVQKPLCRWCDCSAIAVFPTCAVRLLATLQRVHNFQSHTWYCWELSMTFSTPLWSKPFRLSCMLNHVASGQCSHVVQPLTDLNSVAPC